MLDRFAGGNRYRVPFSRMRRPPVRKAIRWCLLLLMLELLLTAGFLAYTLALHLPEVLSPQPRISPILIRSLVVFGLVVGVLYFYWRFTLGYYWAYRRLTLFGKIAPILALISLAIPNVYPSWVYQAEQIIFALLLLALVEIISVDAVRQAVRRPLRLRARKRKIGGGKGGA